MELYVLDEKFNTVGIVDEYDSLIWTDRYNKAGDFEIYTAVTDRLLDLMKPDRYLWWNDTEHTMIIESVTIDTDTTVGNMLTIEGRSLESILDRRIVWNQYDFKDTLPNVIKKLLTDNVISPSDLKRKITGFKYVDTTDPRITSISVEGQVIGDTIYDTVLVLCQTYNIGFKVILNEANEFEFSLYHGDDRSYSQDVNPYVVFSPKFDNVITSNYYENKSTLKNAALVIGEETDSGRTTAEVGTTDTDLNRRELYVDARDISSKLEDGSTISAADYQQKLIQRGNESLAENKYTRTFEGDLDATQTFVYKKDFFIGDVVQIINEYGIEARTRVDEMVYSEDQNGVSYVPTFTVIDEESEEE